MVAHMRIAGWRAPIYNISGLAFGKEEVLERIGGVSGWLRAAAIADAAALPMSTHLFPEVSAHLMCVTPTAHWLEYVDWANPILKTPLEIVAGQAVLRNEPGSGIEWDEAQVKKYAY
jgi:mandelate racemase